MGFLLASDVFQFGNIFKTGVFLHPLSGKFLSEEMDIQKRVWYTKLMMTINQAPLLKRLIITAIATKNVEDISDIESRLMHLGFVHGAIIEVKKKAPLFKEPLLVEVRGRLIALSKAEAELVNVEVQA